MSEAPPETSRAPSHPAPAERWRPLSGIAITAFILSLAGILFAFALWWVEAFPLLLGISAYRFTGLGRKRGRGFATAAIVISIATAGSAYAFQSAFRGHVRTVAEGVLASLSAHDDKALDAWLDADAAEKGAGERLRRRFEAVVAGSGRYLGPVELGSVWTGISPLLEPPSSADEILEPAAKDRNAPYALGTIWVRAKFERETLLVGFVPRGGGQQGLTAAAEALAQRGVTRVVSDVRFFRPRR
jgi:hypothetical protein